MTDHLEALSGQCQCGHIQYRVNGEALTFYACHCLDCQAQSASAFGLSLWVRLTDFELLTGKLKFWTTHADDGCEKQCAFCPECGSRVYHVSDKEIASLKAGLLNNIHGLKPVAHIWTKRAHQWLALENQDVLCFDEEPQDFSGILAAWENQGQGKFD